MAEHRAAVERRRRAELGTEEYVRAAEEIARIEIEIARLAEAGANEGHGPEAPGSAA